MSYLVSWNYHEDGSGIEIHTSSNHPFLAHSQMCKGVEGETLTVCHENPTVAHLRLLCPQDRFATSWKEWRSQERCHSYRTQDAAPVRGESFSSVSRSISPGSMFSKYRPHPVGSTVLHINGDQWACVEDSSSSSDYEEENEEEEVDDLFCVEEGEWGEKGDESTPPRCFSPHSVPSHGTMLKLSNEVVYHLSSFLTGGISSTPPAVFHCLIEALEDGTRFLQQSPTPWFPVSFFMEGEGHARPLSLSTFFSLHFLVLGFHESTSTVILLPEPILCKTVAKGMGENGVAEEEEYQFYPLPLVEVPERQLFLLLSPFSQMVVPASVASLHSGVTTELLPGKYSRVPVAGTVFSSSSSSSLDKKADLQSGSNHADHDFWSPFLNVDLLSRVFHVVPEREYYLSSLHRHVVFLGVCCGLPWIQHCSSHRASSSCTLLGSPEGDTSGVGEAMDVTRRSTRSSPAVPLTLCYQKSDLLQRYGLCEERELALPSSCRNRTSSAEGDAPSSSLGDPNRQETSPHRHSDASCRSSEAPSLSTPPHPEDLLPETTQVPPPSRSTTSLTPSHPTAFSSSSSSSSLVHHHKVTTSELSSHSPSYHTSSATHPTVTVKGPYGTPIHCKKNARSLYGVAFPDRVVCRAGVSAATWSRLMGSPPLSSHRGPLGEPHRPSGSTVLHEDEAIHEGMEATVMGLFHHALVLLFDGHPKARILRSGISPHEFRKAFSRAATTTASPAPVAPLLPHGPSLPTTAEWGMEESAEADLVGVAREETERKTGEIQEREDRETRTMSSEKNTILVEEQQEEPEPREEIPIPSPDMAPSAMDFSTREDSHSSASRETSSTERAVSLSIVMSDQRHHESEMSTQEGESRAQSTHLVEVSSYSTPMAAAGAAATPLINFLKGFATMKLETERAEDGVDTKEKVSLQQLTQYYCRSLDHLLYAHQRYAYYAAHVKSAVDFFGHHTPKEIQAFLLAHEP